MVWWYTIIAEVVREYLVSKYFLIRKLAYGNLIPNTIHSLITFATTSIDRIRIIAKKRTKWWNKTLHIYKSEYSNKSVNLTCASIIYKCCNIHVLFLLNFRLIILDKWFKEIPRKCLHYTIRNVRFEKLTFIRSFASNIYSSKYDLTKHIIPVYIPYIYI